jgi:hypothetical protein
MEKSASEVLNLIIWLEAIGRATFDPYEKCLAYLYGYRFLVTIATRPSNQRRTVDCSVKELSKLTGMSNTKCLDCRRKLMSSGFLIQSPHVPREHGNSRLHLTWNIPT